MVEVSVVILVVAAIVEIVVVEVEVVTCSTVEVVVVGPLMHWAVHTAPDDCFLLSDRKVTLKLRAEVITFGDDDWQ